jgi:hypothetical protein
VKFKLGDHVRVIERTSSHFDKVGTVSEISSIQGHKLPFGLTGLTHGPERVFFGPDELILAEAPQEAAADAVNHPPHYGGKDNPYEVFKVAEAWGFDKDAYLFNVLKYIARAGKKGDALEDHKKARVYLDRKISLMEGAE